MEIRIDIVVEGGGGVGCRRVLRVAAWSDPPPLATATTTTTTKKTALVGAIVQMVDGTLLEYEPPPSPHPSSYSYSSSSSYLTTMTAERTATRTAGRVVPSDAEDMLEPCVSISALRRWRGLEENPDSSSAAAVVNYDDYHNDTEGDHNDIEGEGHGRGPRRRQRGPRQRRVESYPPMRRTC